MTRTRLAACALTTATILLLGACGSDQSKAEDPATTATASGEPTAAASTATPTPTVASPSRGRSDDPDAPPTSPNRPASTFIDYEVVADDGVLISSPTDAAELDGAPQDFKNFIGALITSQAANGVEGCTEAPQISVTRVDTGGWARGSYFAPGCGGSAALWAKADGSWKQAWSGQSLVGCATLERYAFPSRLAGDTCDTGSGTRAYRR